MPDIGVPELLIVLVVAFLLFGAKKLPELARSIGRSASEFKKGIREGGAEDDEPTAASAKPAESTVTAKDSGPPTPPRTDRGPAEPASGDASS
jgi:sec-independent protein translocase protein TatA